jgi:hypothetical protein
VKDILERFGFSDFLEKTVSFAEFAGSYESHREIFCDEIVVWREIESSF